METNRIFDAQRKEQGFKDQQHLDSFFAYYDHIRTCLDCRNYSTALTDDGAYTVREDCAVGKRLFSQTWR